MKFTLQRVRLNSGGYTNSGYYYGNGNPLYWYCSDDGIAEGTIRVNDRADAKAFVRANVNPQATFYN